MNITPEKQQVFDAVNAVHPVSPGDWSAFEEKLRPAFFKRGTCFIEAGKVSQEIAFVLKGAFRAYYIIDGEEKCVDFFLEGQWAKAYHNFLSQSKSKIWVEALEDTEVFLVSYDTLQYLFSHSTYWERFGRLVTERLYISSQQRAEALLLETAEQRYISLVMNRSQLIERIPLYHLASYIGVRQPSLSRIRKRLMSKSGL
ncbi:cAMP-binding domain of CRP or a regulatory subunit of cAMP-dependent protein kinases [Chitinophaga eiseniae]|uniref:cAMP-binding domain of CRP or a regulatory subunit of cAMP-dependent protein kinases n=1 Tax=Chitinophaga eiseniae TaxID=634771 RepID=A0A1T4MZM7_9BACT|nr:Crp/Fnr family transcriptional regulator [Chitinophaga eiseniae]SJZ72351.1 cAMP-binding domain of CRP or a regulatory subunit of cAMP-dependent protein kinases [Chitinophaga eiseniae]